MDLVSRQYSRKFNETVSKIIGRRKIGLGCKCCSELVVYGRLPFGNLEKKEDVPFVTRVMVEGKCRRH